LKKALESCFKQTYKNYEIIVTDNSDNFDTQNYIKKLKNKRIIYSKNLDIPTSSFKSLKKNLNLAKGKYVKILFDDDLLKKTCLQKMVAVFEKHKKVGVVMTPLDIIDNNGNRTFPTFYLIRKMRYLYKYLDHDALVKKEIIMRDFLTRVYPCCVPSGIMVRRSLIKKTGGFNRSFSFIGDLELCMHLAKFADFYYINEFLSSWRFSPTSETVSILHKKGIELDIFYKLTKKYCTDKSIERKAYLFASKRTVINAIAGLRSRNIGLIIKTIRTIVIKDKYFINKIKLPFVLTQEIIRSMFS